jgi:HSP20 family protein
MPTAIAKRPSAPARPWLPRSFQALREEVEDLVSQALGEGEPWPLTRLYAPSLDLSETDTTVEVRMDLPGVKPDQVDVQVSGNLLTVSGERKEEKEEKGKAFHRIERRCGSFARSITLPCPVQEEKVEAQCRDGVLSITLPKTDEAKSHKVKVKAQ